MPAASPSARRPEGYRYYNCRSATRGAKTCPGGEIPEQVLDDAVGEHLAEHYFTEEHSRALVRELVDQSAIFKKKTDDRRQLLHRELDDVNTRIQRWEEAFERGELDPQLGLERVHALRARRAELQETLVKVVPIRPAPASLTSDAAVRRFRETLRAMLKESNNGLARSYLRLLVEKIVVDGGVVRITAKTDAALQVMADGTTGVSTSGPQVRTTVVDWLRMGDSGEIGSIAAC
jgi:Recombinase zinc beta ribbon domain